MFFSYLWNMNYKKHRYFRVFLLIASLAAVLVSCGEKQVPVTGLTVSPATLEMLPGGTAGLTATVTPANATDRNVTWTSSDRSVVSVDPDGIVKALKSGLATVSASCAGKSASCSVKVITLTESLTLDKTELSLRKGETASLNATVYPPDATDKDVSWTSSDPDVVSVDANGSLLALRQGEATVTASCAGKTASCRVTVRDSASGGHEGTGHENWG